MIKLILLSLLQAAGVGAIASAQDANLANPIDATVSMDLKNSVGIVGAGLACLPAAKLVGSDFVDDKGEFADLLRSALANLEVAKRSKLPGALNSRLQIGLTGMKTKLCARSYGIWGMGDRKSLSGNAQFTFEWKVRLESGNIQSGMRIVNLQLKKNEAMQPKPIFRMAIEQFVDQLTQ